MFGDYTSEDVFLALALAAPVMAVARRLLKTRTSPVGSGQPAPSPKVKEIWIYPIKSCGGLRVKQADLDELGLVHV